jgi:hypothetical protein
VRILRVGLERLLIKDDLSVATKIREMHAGFNRQLCHVEIEVVRQRAHHGLHAIHRRADGGVILHVERNALQAGIGGKRCQK